MVSGLVIITKYLGGCVKFRLIRPHKPENFIVPSFWGSDTNIEIVVIRPKTDKSNRFLMRCFAVNQIQSHFLNQCFDFILKSSLGNHLTAVKIWHDNSGGSPYDSSWYLKHIVIRDLHTREKFYFICEKWLALDKDDCLIERVLTLSSDEDKRKLKYLLTKQTEQKFSDSHLWFSIFARPVQSSFTRLDRVTCCFVLLSMSMLMNIMYYGMDNSASQDGLRLGPFANLTWQQLSVGIITNLIVIPPAFLLVQLFRRSKRKHNTISSLKADLLNKLKLKTIAGQEKCPQTDKQKKKNLSEMRFPWWFKIIAYLLAFIFASVSLFFVILKGIEFGNEKASKWLTSVVMSLLSSILLTQPIQVEK